jgi:hypothetical protein
MLKIHRDAESPDRRGPRFVAVVLALEQEMQTRGVTAAVLVECFGPPDLWDEEEGKGVLIYVYDEREAGRGRDEWYFLTRGGRVTDSGYNRRGINKLPGLRPGSEWPLNP